MIHVGVDAGGTLIKTAWMKDGQIETKKYPVSQIRQVAAWINGLETAGVCVTGGKTALLKSLLHKEAAEMVEFDATCRGVRSLLGGGAAEDSFLLTNVGTGTSIHHVQANSHQRIGGTGIGGGTLMGLSYVLTGISDYEEIVANASRGSRDTIDLKVRHIYEGSEPPIPGELTASNFGNMMQLLSSERFAEQDLIASVIGLVGETVATASVIASKSCGVSSVVYIGSSFIRNEPLKQAVQGYTTLRGAVPVFVEKGEYSGAIGAMLTSADHPA